VLEKDQIPNLLKRLSNLNYEIHDFEKKLEDRINLKLRVLSELRRYGLREGTGFKAYLDENPVTKLALRELEVKRRRQGSR
jgi:hypothetical protein